MKFRKEFDSLGKILVPADKYWGASTQRSNKYFDIGDFLVRPIVIKSIAMIKKAAAIVHQKNGDIDKKISRSIIKAANEVISGKLNDHFPLKVWQTGSGTQTNMNVNEVIVNRAHLIEKKSLVKDKKTLSPNDDVNKSQSSNDTFPTAINIAALIMIKNNTLPNLKKLRNSLENKSKQFKNIVKIGRTHMMDATPITLGQEFSGYVSQIDHGIETINNSLKHLAELAIGGTAVGTGLNTPKGYSKKVVSYISKFTGIKFKEAQNKFEAIASHDCIVESHGALKTVASSIFKISNDIRFLGSGPRSGIGELILPSNEPGSSIMPGKVNPTQCEAISMVCTQVMGNDVSTTIAGANGHLELNVFKPLIANNILQSSRILGDACLSFAEKCIDGIKPNKKRIKTFLKDSLMLVTALNSKVGYHKAAEIANKAYDEETTLKKAAIDLNYLTAKEFDEIVNPKKMTNNEG